ncbi:flagellar hook-associated protein FlgK [Sulfuricystis multivorans]|uniref:flagellar hook-associated protein FlgK n=1 Tax=Sulfuricystis multivorans TaxID=2211108 RepID=UPI000F818947|nr:flagellar hook-associated protein FlgK [Sulfuricystis multivorans]
MSTLSIGVSALRNANIALATTSHNIANVNTDGFRRQSVVFTNNPPMFTGSGFIGQGAQIATVQRSYDLFLERQLIQVDVQNAYWQKKSAALGQIDAILGDRSAGVSAALQGFFAAWNDLANDPTSTAARQGVISAAHTLADTVNAQGNYLLGLQDGVNGEITDKVTSINDLARRVAELNVRIGALQGASGHEVNDLLDQRDTALAQLNRLAGVSVIQNNEADVSVFLGGHALVQNGSFFPLTAQAAPYDPARIEVYAGSKALTQAGLIGGELGALLDFRRESLDTAQNALGRIALAVAQQVNTLHQSGTDLAGNLGGLFFADPTSLPASFAAQTNSGTGVLTAQLSNSAQLTTSDYELRYDGANYILRRVSDGQTWSDTSLASLSATAAQGFSLSMTGTPSTGDSFLIRPTAPAANRLEVTIADTVKIAAALPGGGTLDNRNALAIAGLRTDRTVIAGNNSFESAYEGWVSDVGHASSAAKAQGAVFDNLSKQAKAAQQAESGVNLDEEAANLMLYQHYYQAAARMIKVSDELFQTILSLGG